MGGPVEIAAFYHFTDIEDPAALRAWLLDEARRAGVLGTILVAPEGINGTVCAAPGVLAPLLESVRQRLGIAELEVKWARAAEPTFLRLRVKLKKEIITFCQDANPNEVVGEYVAPKDWNALISRDDVLLIDTRNDYEIKTGRFKNAIDPNTTSFTEFADYVDEQLAEHKDKAVAMYCTGGIRCEKATAFLRKKDFKEVYHLRGGILKYLEEVPAEESLWEGECFVFDERVSVDHSLQPGRFGMCHMCGWPLAPEEQTHEHFEAGVSCPRCYGTREPHVIKRARERQKQIALAKQRGEQHMGSEERRG